VLSHQCDEEPHHRSLPSCPRTTCHVPSRYDGISQGQVSGAKRCEVAVVSCLYPPSALPHAIYEVHHTSRRCRQSAAVPNAQCPMPVSTAIGLSISAFQSIQRVSNRSPPSTPSASIAGKHGIRPCTEVVLSEMRLSGVMWGTP